MAYCDEYLELISAAIDGALSPAQQEKLEEHLASCPECKALYEELTAVHAALGDLPPVEVPAGLTERIMAAVAAEQVLPFEKKRSSRPWQRWLASAAVLAVVLMGTWAWKPWNHAVKSSAPQAMDARSVESALTGAGAAADAAPEAVSPGDDQVSPAAAVDNEATVITEAAEDDPAPTLAPEASMINGGAIAAKTDADKKKDMDSSAFSADVVPAQAPEESGEMALRMSRMTPEPKSVVNGGGGGGGEPAMATEAPQEVEEASEADYEEALPEPQPYMMMTTSLPTGDGGAEAILTTEEAATETILTAREALDLVVERCFGDSGYEMFRENLEGDIPSCYVSLKDNDVLVTDGTIVYTGETEDFFLFECHWGDIPEEPYHYSVHKTEGYVAWQGEAPIDGEFRP